MNSILKLVLTALIVVFFCSLTEGSELRLDGGETGWDKNAWYVQVDGVMGGKSSGSLNFEDSDTTMNFSGDIVTDGGGFSSVRKSFFNQLDLTPYAGIVVTVMADEFVSESSSSSSISRSSNDFSPLGLHLQMGDATQRWRFSAPFVIPLASESGSETSLFIPIENFNRGSRSGFGCNSNNCALDPERVSGLDVYVLFQKGDFDVRIKSITAVEDPVSFLSPAVYFSSMEEVRNLIGDTITSGTAVYNYGYVEIAMAKYWSMLSTLLQTPSSAFISDEVKGVICAGFLEVSTETALSTTAKKRNVAQTLRSTIDAVLSDLGGDVERPERPWLPVGDEALSYADQCVGITSVSLDSSLFTSDSTTATTAAPTVPQEESMFSGQICFPGNAQVVEANKGPIYLEDLRIGDSVLTSNGDFSKVYSFGHRDNVSEDITYVELNFDEEGSIPLHISANHFIFVSLDDTSTRAVRAGDLSVGDYILMQVEETTKRVMISEIRETVHDGAFAPFTMSGSLIVNNVAVSSYAMLEGYPDSYSHELAHLMLTPRRLFCQMMMDWCKAEEYNSEGIATWVPVDLTKNILSLVA